MVKRGPLNERITLLSAILAAEAGTSLTFYFAAPPALASAGFNSPVTMLLPHAAAMAVAWVLIALGTWFFSPRTWRLRQEMGTKLRFLRTLFLVALALDNVAAAYLYFAQLATDDVPLQDFNGGILALGLLLRSILVAGFFWLPILVHRQLARRRPQATPAPKFGRG